MDVIRNGNCTHNLYYLLEFLAVWEKRPAYLTLMAYGWCSAISEAAGRLEQREIPIIQPRLLGDDLQREIERQVPFPKSPSGSERLGLKLWIRQDLALGEGPQYLSSWAVAQEFRQVGPCCDLIRLGGTSRRTCKASTEDLALLDYAHLLSITLEIGFRLVEPLPRWLDNSPHHDWVFETAFSSHDDEVVADAACACIAGRDPPGSYVRHFVKRVERGTPFSPRLRRVIIRVIENSPWSVCELEGLMLEIVRLLDHLDVGVDEIVNKDGWGRLLVRLMRSLGGPESLSSHHWRLLDKLVPFVSLDWDFGQWTMEVMGSLVEVEDWEKLETLVAIVWQSRQIESTEGESTKDESMEDVERVTLMLLSRRPSALLRFEDMCETERSSLPDRRKDGLRRICDKARTEPSSSESPLPCVSVRPPSTSLF